LAKSYENLRAFHDAYRELKPSLTYEDVTLLIEDLRDEAQVYIRPDDTVVVFPHKEYSENHIPQKNYHRRRYTKLSASIDRELVSDFARACNVLGITQTSVLIPVLNEIIQRSGIHD
jgi:hypothetical protein